jgi:hypothetical protein
MAFKRTKRTKIFRVRLSFAEHSLIKRKANDAGLTASRFVREAALGVQIKPKQLTEEQKQYYKTLVGLANNMNQIAKKYNQGDRLFVELGKTLVSTQEVINKLIGYDRQNHNG